MSLTVILLFISAAIGAHGSDYQMPSASTRKLVYATIVILV